MVSASPCPDLIAVADLSATRPTPFELAPRGDALTHMADALGVTQLRKVKLVGEISAQAKTDWLLTARLGATIIQPCSVTLEPVTTRIDTDVRRLFLRDYEDPTDPEAEMPEDEDIEALGSHIDLGNVLREALALAVPLYPRAKDAELDTQVFTEPGKAPMTDEDAKPFAGLAALRDADEAKDE